ncbi:hypothetical protein BOTBODRAFT_49664 [Botryobasidium botryosum FD-172 SS1]|uniref:Uncharacterized protein n=1 Tax=Botryobasidium botryosum (strain FD-172 SS1) TaxID=930990 RepID=A0A067M2U1_BOTB1|nr:hypothetical protein BOTBODRAFT_49664 [Botryobasidium botryosum FD-172 SS1]
MTLLLYNNCTNYYLVCGRRPAKVGGGASESKAVRMRMVRINKGQSLWLTPGLSLSSALNRPHSLIFKIQQHTKNPAHRTPPRECTSRCGPRAAYRSIGNSRRPFPAADESGPRPSGRGGGRRARRRWAVDSYASQGGPRKLVVVQAAKRGIAWVLGWAWAWARARAASR